MITGSVARSASRRYLIYSESEPDFEIFRPAGRHVAPMGVKFGKEELQNLQSLYLISGCVRS